jgi:hypothetical protein
MSGSSINYSPLNSLSAPTLTTAEDDDDDGDAELMTGRISSANLYSLGPVTSDRAYHVVSTRDQLKKAALEEAGVKKADREKTKDVKQNELRLGVTGLQPKSGADLSKLTIPKLQGLLLRDDGQRWDSHAKLKSRKELLNVCMSLYGFPQLALMPPPVMPPAVMPPALMPPACLCPHPSVCDE